MSPHLFMLMTSPPFRMRYIKKVQKEVPQMANRNLPRAML